MGLWYVCRSANWTLETMQGPFAITYVNPADDPSKAKTASP